MILGTTTNKMNPLSWKLADNVFKMICIFATFALVIWCCYEFYKNEDVCEIIFKTFQEDEDSIYPDVSFVIPNQFNETVLKSYNKGFTSQNYQAFLNALGGTVWDEKLLAVNFDDVTMKLDDYLIETCIYTSMFSKSSGDCENYVRMKSRNYFGAQMHTMTFPQNMLLHSASIKLRKSIFSSGVRPTTGQFFVLLSYPNQMYRGLSSSFNTWPSRTNHSTKNYNMRFLLKGMEVLRRRQKKDQKCYIPKHFDDMIFEGIISRTGCRPIFWHLNTSAPLCTTHESYQRIMMEHTDQVARLNKTTKYPEPCLEIQKLQIEYIDEDIQSLDDNHNRTSELKDNDWFMIEFTIMTNNFKEIKQIRQYSVQSLVGNLGGYIGLCLGYAILNLPSIVLEIWNYMKQVCHCFKRKKYHSTDANDMIMLEKGNLKTSRSRSAIAQDQQRASPNQVMVGHKPFLVLGARIRKMELQMISINKRLEEK